MRSGHPEEADRIGLMARWGILVLALLVGGLLLSSRAGDDYTAVFGLLLAGFGVLLGFRLLGRVTS